MKVGPKPLHTTLKPYWSAFLKHGQQAWAASSTSMDSKPGQHLQPAPTSHNAAIELLLNHTKWLPHIPPQQQPQQDQQHQRGAMQSSPGTLSLSYPTFTVGAATNFLVQPSQTANLEAWQQCTEPAITLAAPTQPQEEARPTYSTGYHEGAPSARTPSMEAPMGE